MPPPTTDRPLTQVGFESILSLSAAGETPGVPVDADAVHDLHLDEIVATVTAGREAYDLTGFFNAPLTSPDAVVYRQEVFRDLEDGAVLSLIRDFAAGMSEVRTRLARSQASRYRYERERWFLDATAAYRATIADVAAGLVGGGSERLRSPGLQAFRAWLVDYVAGPAFTALDSERSAVQRGLDTVRYRLHVVGGRVRISRLEGEADLAAEVLATFERFAQATVEPYRFRLALGADMNHVEAEIVARVALLYPEPFAALDAFCASHTSFLDPTIARFDREIQFYLAYREHIDSLKATGLTFCYPTVDDGARGVDVRSSFDLALAASLAKERGTVVVNDVRLEGPERILVVSGPNSGGKTTFARMVGQLHHLARLGCPVPGSQARLPLVDRIFTHFERPEDVHDERGKLEDDLRRVQRILQAATPHSLVLLNELFGSTTVQDALYLSREVMGALISCDLLCVAVTFLDELATLGPSTVSLVSTVDPADSARRTFEIVRRPADGLAYALAIAERHRLTYASLKARLSP